MLSSLHDGQTRVSEICHSKNYYSLHYYLSSTCLFVKIRKKANMNFIWNGDVKKRKYFIVAWKKFENLNLMAGLA